MLEVAIDDCHDTQQWKIDAYYVYHILAIVWSNKLALAEGFWWMCSFDLYVIYIKRGAELPHALARFYILVRLNNI